ncbi:MAG: hypothetical protein N4A53_14435 [Pelagimonas sp.]|jgi:hypothetical protein|nr:hypothetical protein [Pelagimonas sp.]
MSNTNNALSVQKILITTTDETGYIRGTHAAERIRLGNDNYEVFAQGGDDVVAVGAGDDLVRASNGNDTVRGGAGSDSIYGENGNDILRGFSGKDYIVGGAGDDRINGGSGSDQLFSGPGDDFVFGGTGDDRIYAGAGRDTLMGGQGKDVFIVSDDSTDRTIILDYTEGQDKLTLVDVKITGYTEQRNGTVLQLSNGGDILFKNRFADDVDFDALMANGATAQPVPLYQIIGDATSGEIPIYILAGQSNAVSLLLRNALLEELEEQHSDFVLVRSVASGTILDQVNWGVGDWHPESTGELYDQLLADVAEAIAAVEARGLTADVQGLFWVHGSADTRNFESASEYGENLNSLLSALHADLDPDLRFVLSEVPTTLDKFVFHETVRDEQNTFAAEHDLVEIVETSGFELQVDEVHYSRDGFYELADALVDALF